MVASTAGFSITGSLASAFICTSAPTDVGNPSTLVSGVFSTGIIAVSAGAYAGLGASASTLISSFGFGISVLAVASAAGFSGSKFSGANFLPSTGFSAAFSGAARLLSVVNGPGGGSGTLLPDTSPLVFCAKAAIAVNEVQISPAATIVFVNLKDIFSTFHPWGRVRCYCLELCPHQPARKILCFRQPQAMLPVQASRLFSPVA